MHGERGCVRGGVHLPEFALNHLEEAVIGADPDAPLIILHQTADKAVGQPGGLGIGAKNAILEMDQAAAIGTEPEAAIARGKDAKDAVVGKDGGRGVVVEAEMRPVEPHQTAGCSYPEISIP